MNLEFIEASRLCSWWSNSVCCSSGEDGVDGGGGLLVF